MEFPPAAQNLMSDFLFVEAISSIVAKVEMAKKYPFAKVKKNATWSGKRFAVWASSGNVYLLLYDLIKLED